MPKFDDETIEQIFGAEDAENEAGDRFKQYFFYNKTYENLTANLPIRILVGHKGIGKSALLRRAFLDNLEKSELAVWVRPNDLIPKVSISKDADFNQLIEDWKTGLQSAVAEEAIKQIADTPGSETGPGLVLSGAQSVIPFLHKIFQEKYQNISNITSKTIMDNFFNNKTIYIYIDDIDRGWAASKNDIKNISALLNSIRDICGNDNNIRVRIGLRSDVYYLIRTSDESTDKIERNVIWLKWSNHEILSVMAKRIETFFGSNVDQSTILKYEQSYISSHIFSKVITPRFEGRGKWADRPIHNVVLSMTRARPRDLVKLMHGAAKNAYLSDNEIITSQDLQKSFEPYSAERLRDIINEFRTELPQIESLLLNMRPTKKQRRTSDSYLFTTDSLIKKLKDIKSRTNLVFKSGIILNEKSLLQFLYKIDFITARKFIDGALDRKYFDQSRFLANEFVDFGYDWEIHPAYRWALQPENTTESLDSILDRLAE